MDNLLKCGDNYELFYSGSRRYNLLRWLREAIMLFWTPTRNCVEKNAFSFNSASNNLDLG